MLSDVVVVVSGLAVLFTVFDWIPNGIIDIFGYKNIKSENKNGNK